MARTDLTAIYYTANREAPHFAARIRETLVVESGGIPVISVSQEPLDFGRNLCVGRVGASGHNAWRQVQIGVEAAATRFVCMAEADFLHPREYFEFMPATADAFSMAVPLYVLFAQRGKSCAFFPKPRPSEGSMVVGRDFLLARLTALFAGKPQWTDGDAETNVTNLVSLCSLGACATFQTAIPTVTFKTDNGMHRKTPIVRSGRVRELPYWGTGSELIRRYCHQGARPS